MPREWVGDAEACVLHSLEEVINVDQLENALINDNEENAKIIGRSPSKSIGVDGMLFLVVVLTQEDILDQVVDRISNNFTEFFGIKDKSSSCKDDKLIDHVLELGLGTVNRKEQRVAY